MDAPMPCQPAELAPTPAARRIEALDVVRGFALIGICLMNMDFFNRSVLNVGTGMPPGLSGIDYAAAFFTAYFVTGKFWTIFSLLFGMGFAVMLANAESAGRSFLAPYLRRIAALAVIGALHDIFIWGGDILFSYAMAAAFLLLVEYASWKVFAGAITLSLASLAIPGAAPFAGGLAATLASAGLVALYMRGRPRARAGRPVAALVLLAAAAVALLAGAVMWAGGVGPQQARAPALAIGLALLLTAWLVRFNQPVSSRAWRIGVALWVVSFGMMAIFGAASYFGKPAAAQATGARPAIYSAAPRDDKAARREAERAKALKERAARIETDTRTMTTGTYADGVALRAAHFATRPQRQLGFSVLLIAVFLIGTWFVRSGVMENTRAHLPLFRRLALFGIPIGVGLGLAGSGIATSFTPDGAWQLASSLLMLGNLPASIGYASAVILMLHSRSVLAKVRVLAPFGRMALTNYIMQSLVCAIVFYGYGFGQWGMGRATQLVFALGLCAVQVGLSHLWLSRFRYGPLEWVWRAVTYLKLPAMRIARVPAGAVPQAH